MSRSLRNLFVCLLVLSLALGIQPYPTATESYNAPSTVQPITAADQSSVTEQPQKAPDTEIIIPGASTPTLARPSSPNLAPDYFAATGRSLDIISKTTPNPTPEAVATPEERLALASSNTSTELSSSEQSEYRSIVKKVFGMETEDKRLALEYVRRLSPVELMQVAVWFIRDTRETRALLYAKLEQHFTQQEIGKMEELVCKYR